MVRKKKEVVKKEEGMNKEALLKAAHLLETEKGIHPDIIFGALELALTSAYKKNYGLPNARVDIDRETGDVKVYSFKTVVNDPDEYGCINYAEVEKYYEEHQDELDNEDFVDMPEVMFDANIHLTLNEASKLVPGIKIGETIEKEVTPKDFGRVAASTAKQVVVQKIREAEREVIINEFSNKEDEMVTGLVAMEDERNYFIDLGRTQGILPKSETIPGEKIVMGSSIKVYITKVDNSGKGPLILLSRTHYGFVKRLFELEIPEINDGLILVHSVAREAGVRSKIAVESINSRIDAVGSCIGERGVRIANILKELGGEKVDVVTYSEDPIKFIENALAPAKNITVIINNLENREATAIVDNENLSLAIGKKGLNVRLAARLTRFKIDVKTYEDAKADGINIIIGD